MENDKVERFGTQCIVDEYEQIRIREISHGKTGGLTACFI